MAVHQCARFNNDPRMPHEKAAKRIVRYLRGTQEKGMILNPEPKKGLECFVDADFAGGFSKYNPEDPTSCLSRTGYIITYANCPIIWSSKLQSTTALSTTEAEYLALSAALRDVIFVLHLLDELGIFGVDLVAAKPVVRCKVFEDNCRALELAKAPKLRPRTKHIAIPYHHFREYVAKGRIILQYVNTKEQVADIATKPLPRDQFRKLRDRLLGWEGNIGTRGSVGGVLSDVPPNPSTNAATKIVELNQSNQDPLVLEKVK